MQTATLAPERLHGYLRVARAPFLALPVTLIVLGTATAMAARGFDPLHALLAFVGLLSLHVSVNARNEYRDYQSGIDLETDPTPFSGGSKALPEGALEPEEARRFALVTAGVGALIGAYFLVTVGALLVPIIVVGGVSVLFYTSHLAKSGLGELFAGLGLGGLPVLGTGLVQLGTVPPALLVASVPPTLLTFNLLLLNEFPDQEADRRGGRRNLIHRLGRRGAALVYSLAAFGVPVSIVAGVALGFFAWPALLGALPSLALVRPISWALGSPSSPVSEEALRDNVLWILSTNLLLAAGLLIGGV
ncbi:MAG: prenyltransferase [Halodesulfurarchaeum sp.]